MNIETITITGKIIQLEPLALEHVTALAQIGLDEDIWQYMLYGEMRTLMDMHAWVQDMLDRQQRGADLPFVVRLASNGQIVGCTRYLNIDRPNRSLEIGGTWYGKAYQGSGVNAEAKYLLLRHAFENLGCIRVQFKTDSRNLRSQRAIEKLGAQREGLLRNHMILPGGHIRHSVFYSIIPDEWPQIKANLEKRLSDLK